MSVEIIDKGWASIKFQMSLIHNSYTKVGYPEIGKPANPTKGGSGHEPLVQMSEMVTVAAVNEFGAPKSKWGPVPARPFVRPAFDENISELTVFVEGEYLKIIDGKSGVKKSLERIGEWMKAKIQKKIVEIKEPPNSPVTIARKKSSNPLIDTGQMRQSVQHVEVIK